MTPTPRVGRFRLSAIRGRSAAPLRWRDEAAIDRRGFTLIEVLIALMVLSIAFLAIAGMFPTGYRQVTDAGRMTLAVTAARQMLEDVRTLPFDNLDFLNNFDSDNAATQPADYPERGVARRWRYAVAGDGAGFGFTADELDDWQTLSPFGGRVTVQVQQAGLPATLRLVTVNVFVEALRQNVQISTVIVRM